MSLLLAPIYGSGAPAPGAVALGDTGVEDGYLSAYWTIGNDGLIYHQTLPNQRAFEVGTWIAPQVGMNLYECQATQLDTTPPAGTYNTWLDLAASWTWGFAAPAGSAWGNQVGRSIDGGGAYVNDRQGQFQLQIRRKADLAIVETATITIFAGGNA